MKKLKPMLWLAAWAFFVMSLPAKELLEWKEAAYPDEAG